MVDHSRLGRGLASLMGEVSEESPSVDSARKPRRAPVENLTANPHNPRRNFTEAELNELAASIKEHGIIQPIVVRPARAKADHFEIIAGERRWRAAQRAGLHDVPIAIVEATDAQALEFAIIENVQRADLNPIEEAAGYQALMEKFDRSQDDVAQIVGKSRSHVANLVRLLKLSEPVKALISSGQLSAGHARQLVGQPNALEVAQEIIKRGLNVRQVEAAARKDGTMQARDLRNTAKGYTSGAKDPDTKALEKKLSDALGLAVSVDHRGQGGTLHIKYRDLDQLDGVIRKLGK
ncbi:MAG: ParB/RepB/Spo0J family partition protein [Pseudolabrys sp.]|nr:ParB/RepB/Spo0J family partition protein [Pseudolabrys sp.]MSP33201.1 ParB/RepB/Spo0J family partition protein [Pseudolabrys sp.]